MNYFKRAFDVVDFNQAKNVVLTFDTFNPFKYEQETLFLVNTILKNVEITSNTRMLDFGCGIGRVSKVLIEKTNCFVYGVDISESMINFAIQNINSKRNFTASKSFPYDEYADIALSCLALQHAEDPLKEIKKIYSCLIEDGIFILVNENKRLVPIGEHNNYVVWHDDKVNIHEEVKKYFLEYKRIKYLSPDVDIIFYKKLTVAQ